MATSSNVEKDKLYPIDKIMQRKYFPCQKEYYYFMRWKGYGRSENSWEPESVLRETASLLVDKFNEEFERNKKKKTKSNKKAPTLVVRKKPVICNKKKKPNPKSKTKSEPVVNTTKITTTVEGGGVWKPGMPKYFRFVIEE